MMNLDENILQGSSTWAMVKVAAESALTDARIHPEYADNPRYQAMIRHLFTAVLAAGEIINAAGTEYARYQAEFAELTDGLREYMLSLPTPDYNGAAHR